MYQSCVYGNLPQVWYSLMGKKNISVTNKKREAMCMARVLKTYPDTVYGNDEAGNYYENFGEATIVETDGAYLISILVYEVDGGVASFQTRAGTAELSKEKVGKFFSNFHINQCEWEEI